MSVRPLVCRRCGKPFAPETVSQTMCPACRLEARRASYRRERICQDCGQPFIGVPRQRRCPRCQAAAEAEWNRAHKRTGPRRPLGSTDTCERCGAPYVVQSGAQRYCPACGPIALAENERAKKRREKAAERAAGIPTFHAPIVTVCAVCGRPFHAKRYRATTCSPECKRELDRRQQRAADAKRRQPKKKKGEAPGNAKPPSL